MGGRGNANVRNSGSTVSTSTVQENEYGFDVTVKDPDIEFTDNFWKEMLDLKNTSNGYDNAFQDQYLADAVRNKMYELGGNETDEESRLWYRGVEGENVTDDEMWASYHALARELGVKTPRYTAGTMDSDNFYYDTQFSSTEQAEEWGRNRNLTHIYDRLTGKYRKIGNKNWTKG